MVRSFSTSRLALYFIRTLPVGLIALLLVACTSGTGATQPAAGPMPAPVNGFGVAANHVHSLLVLPNHVLILATHYGLFRSQDNGTTLRGAPSGPHQLLARPITYALS